MKITKVRLKQIIKEELMHMQEADVVDLDLFRQQKETEAGDGTLTVVTGSKYRVLEVIQRDEEQIDYTDGGSNLQVDVNAYEIKLSEELASKVYDYIEKLKEDDDNILSGNTKGKILW